MIAEEKRSIRPAWKDPFDYEEGCFPCESCVGDLMNSTSLIDQSLAPVMQEFQGVESSVFASRRLEYLERTVDSLMPELALLDPQQMSQRLQPLEGQLAEQQKRINSLNVVYRMNNMNELSLEADALKEMGKQAVDDMAKVNEKIDEITKDMRNIADGLDSGLTPEQIETAVQDGQELLDAMKETDFKPDRANANADYRKSMDLVEEVKKFAKPVEDFKEDVTLVENRQKELTMKLDDLHSRTDGAAQDLREAKILNFRNSNPAVINKLDDVKHKIEASEANVQLGNDLNREADEDAGVAINAFDQLVSESQNILDNVEILKAKVDNDRAGINQNMQRIQEASEHAVELENQVHTVTNYYKLCTSNPKFSLLSLLGLKSERRCRGCQESRSSYP